MSADIKITDIIKGYTLDQDKAVSPEETTARVKERFRQSGIQVLKRTERIDNGRLDIPVFISECGPDALKVMPTRKQMGKGATPQQAEASAVMEMVERFSLFHFMKNEPFLKAAYQQIKDQALPFLHIAASVHHDVEEDLERAEEVFSPIKLEWTTAYNLTRNKECLLPINWFFEINEFNGPAAGNFLEEAIMQGLAEVVERHVSALICRGNLETPHIDPASIQSDVGRELYRKFTDNGIKVFIKDFTLGMGIPTVGALAYDPSTFPDLSEIVFTAGTATDPEKALIRALTEVAQLAGDFNTKANFLASGLPKYTSLAQAEYITHRGETVPLSSLPQVSSDNFKEEIERTVAALAERGFEVYVIDVTHPQVKTPAVYTIVPGAHFRERAIGSSVPFFAAKILSRESDPFLVADELARLERLYPDRYYIKFYEAQRLIDLDRPDEAVKKLQRALALNPPKEDEAGILTYLGLALKDLGEYHQAIEYLKQSADLDDERRDTYNLLGYCYFKTKNHEAAIEAFRQVLRLDPGSGIDYANIGTNLRELGQIDQAVKYYKTALELDPSLTWVWDNLAALEVRLEQS